MEINLSEGLRDLMRRYPQGVAVVTTTWKGKMVGMTVNTFNSLSLNPPWSSSLPIEPRVTTSHSGRLQVSR